MSLASISVRRRITMIMLYIFVIGFGIFSLLRLKVDLYPDMEIPYIVIFTTYAGASPEDMETLVTRPIEQSAVSVRGLKNILSTQKFGFSSVMLEFEWGYDMDRAETDARRKLEMIERMLPQDADAPVVFAMNPSMQPIIFVAISSSSLTPLQLYDLVDEKIKPRVERVDGISSVNLSGGEKREILVKLDPAKMEAFGVSSQMVSGALRSENMQSAAGNIKHGSMDFEIQIGGKFKTIDEIGMVLIGMRQDETGMPIPIRLRDVAEVEDTVVEKDHVMRIDGKAGLLMLIQKQSGANTVQASEAVIKAMPEIFKSAGEDLEFTYVFKQSDFIRSSINNLAQTAGIAVVVVFFVLLIFLKSFRSALVVSMAIPVSIVTTFTAMNQLNMSLNILSLAGLALAVGMLVDNAIVVLENIFRFRQEGKSNFQSTIKGTEQVGLAVTASTLTTVAVFFPILFVPGIAGIMFRDMALTVCISLGASLLVSLTFVPMSSFFMFRASESEKKSSGRRAVSKGIVYLIVLPAIAAAVAVFTGMAEPIFSGRIALKEENATPLLFLMSFAALSVLSALFMALTKFFAALRKKFAGEKDIGEDGDTGVMEKMRNGYASLLANVLRFRAVFLISVIVLFAIAIYGFKNYVRTDFMSKGDNGFVNINVEAEIGDNVDTAFDVMHEVVDTALSVVKKEELRSYMFEAGQNTGNAFAAMQSKGMHTGRMYMSLVPATERDRSLNEILDALRDAFRQVPGTKIQVREGGGMGGTSNADATLEIYNDDLKYAREVSRKIEALLLEREDVSEVSLAMEEQKTQIGIRFDRQKMAELGLTTGAVSSLISVYFRGMIATRFSEGGNEYDIKVRLDSKNRKDLSEIHNMPVLTQTGESIPLSSFATIAEELGPTAITRKNQARYVTLEINLKNEYVVDGVTYKKDMQKSFGEISRMLDKYRTESRTDDKDWTYALSGTASDFQESFMFLGLALILSIFLVYMVMASQFESLRQPFIVIFAVPLAFIGVAGIFILTGNALDVSALIGGIMLVGIVVNNGIVMVDAANQFRVELHLNRVQGIIHAARTRLRPIMLTSLTTILSMIPLTLEIGEGAEMWSGMAQAVIGGLAFASVLTLFVIPAIYTLIAEKEIVVESGEDVEKISSVASSVTLRSVSRKEAEELFEDKTI